MRITQDIRYIGVNDHRDALFEGQYRVPNGMSYNSYVILDEKIAVLDTVDVNFTEEWLRNLELTLCGKKPDYLVIHHMEPDHSASLCAFMECYPDTIVVASAKAFTMMKNFFGTEYEQQRMIVTEGSELSLGKHTLAFLTAMMVHWPEVVLSYDSEDHVLFSADAFGKFGALDMEDDWVSEARRYYIGIVGKYGAQVYNLLQKVGKYDVHVICPLHGPVLDKELEYYLYLYRTWASYEPEKSGVVIAYASVYGNTKQAAELLRDKLRESGCETVIYDLARDDIHEAIAAAFCYDRLVLASSTYNGDVFPPMKTFLHGLTERNFQKRSVAMMENGSWAPMAAKVMSGMLEKSRELKLVEPVVRIHSAMNKENMAEIEMLSENMQKAVDK